MNDLDCHRVSSKKIYRIVIRYVSLFCGRQIFFEENRFTRMRNIEDAEILIGFWSTTSLKNWFEFVSESWDTTNLDWSSIQNDSRRYQRYYCVKLMIESSPRYGGPSVWRKNDRPKYDRIVISFETTEKEDGEWWNEINICYLKRIYHIISFLRIIRLVSSMMWNSYTCKI